MIFSCFIGIDVSKLTIDVVIYKSTNLPVLYERFDNSASGFRALLAWISKHTPLSNALFCLEHTGIYALPICCFFTQQKLHYSLQSALQVKKSMGIQRGKNDKADAAMLARYAYLYREEIKLSQVPSQTLMKIQYLLAYRQRLVKSKAVRRAVALAVSASELAAFTDKSFSTQITRDSAKHI